MAFQILLFCFWFVLAVAWIRKGRVFQDSGFRSSFLVGLFGLKMLFGAGLVVIYTFYYPDRSTADIYKFYDDAAVLHEAAKHDPEDFLNLMLGTADAPQYSSRMKNWAGHSEQWLRFSQTEDTNFFHSNRLITRIHAALWPLSAGWIYTHLIFFNVFSMLGWVVLFRLLRQRVAGSMAIHGLVWMSVLPSVVLWCSGLLKDTLVLAALSFLLAAMFDHKLQMAPRFGLAMFSVLLLLWCKFYVLVAVMAAWPVVLIYRYFTTFRKRILAMALYVGMGIALLYQNVPGGPGAILSAKREEALKTAVLGDARMMEFWNPAPEGLDRWREAFPAISRAWFAPYLWTSGQGALTFISSLEGVVLALGMVLVLWKRRKSLPHDDLAWFIVAYSLILGYIIGFTTPVTGGLVRYKTAFLPLLVWMFGLPVSVPNWLQRYLNSSKS